MADRISDNNGNEIRTLSIVVDNVAGVLSKVTGLFSRRGYNIDSLAVGTTEKPEFSRITVKIHATGSQVSHLVLQLEKLPCVGKVVVLEETSMIQRELIVIKVKADSQTRGEIIEIVNIFRGKIIDLSPESVIVEVTGEDDKAEAVIRMLSKFGIIEMARTGVVALGRGRDTIYGD
ncbi:MAG: acetolactate synthase small subunit [Clostridia bacterium]|nr:acetolactate synthase small subunit [Clostridia bacterium]MCR5693948.1 acetolactate synthase small subunit [Clostridia bacterium]